MDALLAQVAFVEGPARLAAHDGAPVHVEQMLRDADGRRQPRDVARRGNVYGTHSALGERTVECIEHRISVRNRFIAHSATAVFIA